MIRKKLLLLLLPLLLVVPGCSDTELSQEDEIRQWISGAIAAAEDRSASDLGELIHANYIDQKGYNKTQTIKLLSVYFFRHKNIYLFTKIRSIDFPAEDVAQVVLHVAMAGSVISDASLLSGLKARLYKFELELIKQDNWLMRDATWKPASIADLE